MSDLDLKAVGAARYAEHPSTRIVAAGFITSSGDRVVWFAGEELDPRVAAEMADDSVLKLAFNAEFDRTVWNAKNPFGITLPAHAVECLAVRARIDGYSTS